MAHGQSSLTDPYDIVPAESVYRVFQEAILPDLPEFQLLKNGLYGRDVGDGINHLLKIQAMKGTTYTLWWGVWLTYMPHEWEGPLRWHRTIRMARFDLFESPYDYYGREYETRYEHFVADRFFGVPRLTSNVARLWKRMQADITAWFSTTRSLSELLSKAARQVKRPWPGPRHFPAPELVYLFTLARMGELEGAGEFLEEYCARNPVSELARRNLSMALNKAHNR